VLERHKANDTKHLNEARERTKRQHTKLLQAQTTTLNAVTNLTTEIQSLRQDNCANANGTSRTTEILAELVRKKF
jgi:prefoldin subunit 5